MDSEAVDKILANVQNFKTENAHILKKWHLIISEAKDEIFKSSCLKNDQFECDHYHCIYEEEKQCSYLNSIAKLNKIMQIDD